MTTLGIVLSIVSATIFIWTIVSAFFISSENEYLNDQLAVNKFAADRRVEELRGELAQLRIDLDFARSEAFKEKLIEEISNTKEYYKNENFKLTNELNQIKYDMSLIIKHPRSVELLNFALNEKYGSCDYLKYNFKN